MSVNFISRLIPYNKVQILLIIAVYTFAKILSELVEVTLRLPPVLSDLYLIFLTLLIICKLLLSTIKRYISLHNRAIFIKTRKTSFISQTGNIKKANLNLKAIVITNLITYLGFFFKNLFRAKDVLYIIKKIVGLQITHNQSVMT